MDKMEIYDDFPLWIPFIAILVSVISYFIGAIILSGFGIIFAILYIMYCVAVELMIIFRSCKNCWYYGRFCGLGKGKIAPLFVEKGDTKKFADRDISMVHMIPDFMVVISPLAGGIVLLILDFSINILVLMVVLAILFFGGTAFIRSIFACKYCKQREIGCPADEMFNKNRKGD